MPVLTSIVASGLPPAPSAFSVGILAGSLLQVSGQGPIDPDGSVRSDLDAAEQTRLTLDHVCRVLTAGGGSFSDVVMLRVYLTDRRDFDAMNRVYEEYVAKYRGNVGPARTTVIVGLPFEGMLVEMDALAVLTDSDD